MVADIIDLLGSNPAPLVSDPEPPPDDPPTEDAFEPYSITFSPPSSEVGSIVEATILGYAASSGGLAALASYTDSAGHTWTVISASTVQLVLQTTTIAPAAFAKLTVTTVGGNKISGNYSVTAAPTGGFPLSYLKWKSSGACGAGFQQGAASNGNSVMIISDVAGTHLSIDGGRTYSPVRDGQNTPNKLRGAGVVNDGLDWYVFFVGFAGAANLVGTGVTSNGILKATQSAFGTLGPWTQLVQLPNSWASAQSNRQKGDTKASLNSGHPRQSGMNMLAYDKVSKLFYCGSWDGVWRVTKTGAGITRIWGGGNSVTGVALDPNAANTIYATVDLGPKVGVWKLTGTNGSTITEAGVTGPTMDYPQDVKAFSVGGITRVIVATGKAVQGAAATWALAYHSNDKPWKSDWRDITGNLVARETQADLRTAGVDVWVNPDGTVNLAAGHAYDTQPGGNSGRIWWSFNWNLTGVPVWKGPADATVTYQLARTGPLWWFKDKQPSFMADKSGFDARPLFIDANHILFVGRSGLAMYDRPHNSLFPVNQGLQVTYAWDVTCSVLNKLWGWSWDTDWNGLMWNAGPWSPPVMSSGAFNGAPAKEVAWTGGQNAAGSIVCASGEAGEGSVKVCHNPYDLNRVWIDETATGANKPPAGEYRGCALWGQGTGQVLLAAHQNGKIYRKVGSGANGAWDASPVMSGAALVSQNRVLSDVSGNTVVMCSQSSGLWRSTNKGAADSWETLRTGGSGGITSGHVKRDRITPGRFWHVAGGKLYRVDAGVAGVTVVGSFDKAAWVGCYAKGGKNELYVVENGTARLWRSTTAGATWDNITTESFRHTTGGVVRGGDITLDGVIVLACQAGYCTGLIDATTAT